MRRYVFFKDAILFKICIVQAGLPIDDNRSKFSPRAQFCSVLAEILTVFLTAPYAQICLRILAEIGF